MPTRPWRLPTAAALVLLAFAASAEEPPATRSGATKPPALPATSADDEARRALIKQRDELENTSIKLQQEGKLEAAVEAARKVDALNRQLYGAVHAAVARSQRRLAILFEKQNDFVSARTAQQEKLRIELALHAAGHWHIADARLELQQLEQVAKLTAEQRQELATAADLNGQVYNLWNKRRAAEALPLAQKALEIRGRLLGEDSLSYAQSLLNLAAQYHQLKNTTEAERLYRQTLDLRQRLTGESHPDYASVLRNLASMLHDQDKPAAAEPLFAKAAKIRQETMGDSDLEYALDLRDLARVYRDQQKVEQSFTAYSQALQLARKRMKDEPKRYLELLGEIFNYCEFLDDVPRTESFGRELLVAVGNIQGHDSDDYGTMVNNYAASLIGMARFGDAEKLLEEASQRAKDKHTEESGAYASTIANLAELYREMGQLQRALPLSVKAYEITQRQFGDHNSETLAALDNLALLYHDIGDDKHAMSRYEQALQDWEKVPLNERSGLITCLTNFAGLLEERGDFERSEKLLLRAAEVRRELKISGWESEGKRLEDLAQRDDRRHDKLSARDHFAAAVELYRKNLGEGHPKYILALSNYAQTLAELGDFVQGESLLLKALDSFERIHGRDSIQVDVLLNNLGGLYDQRGDLSRAEHYYRRSLAVKERHFGKEHPRLVDTMNNLATLYLEVGDSARAETMLRASLEIVRKAYGTSHPSYANTVNSLASIYSSAGQYTTAEKMYRQALEIEQKVGDERNPGYVAILNNLAHLYCVKEEFDKAEPLYLRILELRRTQPERKGVPPCDDLNNVGWFYSRAGNAEKAEKYLQQSLDVAQREFGKNHPDYSRSLANLAGLYHENGKFDSAETLMRQALEIELERLENNAAALSERQQRVWADQILEMKLSPYLSLARQTNLVADAGYSFVFRWKGVAFVRQQLARAERGRPELADKLAQLQAINRALAQRILHPPDNAAAVAVWKKELNQLTEQKEQLEADLAQTSQQFRQQQQQRRRPRTIADLQAAVPVGVALVDIIEYDEVTAKRRELDWQRSIAAYVIRRDRPIQLVRLGRCDNLEKSLESWRKSLVTASASKDSITLGRQFRELVWTPLEPHLSGVSVVLVAPDGNLARVPWAALPGKNEGEYLIDELSVAVIPVPQLLPSLDDSRSDVEPGQGLLVVGNIDFGRPSDDPAQVAYGLRPRLQYGSLPGTAVEATFVSELVHRTRADFPCDLLAGAAASEPEICRRAPRYAWLHLGTHGFFQPGEAVRPKHRSPSDSRIHATPAEDAAVWNPGLLSALVFAGANDPNRQSGDESNDGLLTAAEVSNLDLRGVDMVTLSACETGLGPVAGGEGLLGLQRAFQVAGARTTIASMWKVNDAATSLLIEEFYRNLLERKLSKLAALREAQRFILHNGDRVEARRRALQQQFAQRGLVFKPEPISPAAPQPLRPAGPALSHPALWAGFVLSGDWR